MGTIDGTDWYFEKIVDPLIENASPKGWNKVGNINYLVSMGNNVRVFTNIVNRETVSYYNQQFNFDYNKNDSNDKNKYILCY